MVALAHMGGPDEACFSATAQDWTAEPPDLHTLAVECVAGSDARWLPRVAGLPDDAFEHDGKITKREFRAAAVARLHPHAGALLWDVGAGCGSIAVEWLRAAVGGRAIAVEPDPARRSMAGRNAAALGVPEIDIREGRAPEALLDLPAPDAVFFGGGLSAEGFGAAIGKLKPGGRLVAHAVTLESEALLLDFYRRHGGELTRLSVARAEPLGGRTAWRAAMPVTQWAWVKP
jgi:precorrin-6Y C5,15-methyltransferase (decarboxylating)